MYDFPEGCLCDACADANSMTWRGRYFKNNNEKTICEYCGENELEQEGEDIDVS